MIGSAPMSRATRAFAVAAAVVALAGLAAGCSGAADGSGGDPASKSSTTPTDPTTPPPPKAAKAPTAGSCRVLDIAAVSRYSNDDPTVACSARHNAYTFAVNQLPASVSVSGVSVGNKSIQDAASTRCREAFAGFIGGTAADRALSRLSVTYFVPDQRDFNLGADWIRCDVVAFRTHDQLAPLPRRLHGILNDPDALEPFGLCSDGDPSAATSRLVMCTEKHTFRAKTALRLGDDAAAYPGQAVTGADGQRRCLSYLKQLLDRSGGFTFGWTYPTAADWETGQRFGYCYLRTTE